MIITQINTCSVSSLIRDIGRNASKEGCFKLEGKNEEV